jgi:ferrous iron transport protein B
VLIGLVIPNKPVLGVFTLQGLVLMGLYLLGFLAAILSAWVMKFLVNARERSLFIMEFPVYRMPRWKNVGLTIIEKVRTFVWEAGKVIMAISIILWVMASYGPGDKMQQAEKQAEAQSAQSALDEQQTAIKVESARLEESYAGHFGRVLEPVIRPLGFDWKIGIALITSMAAREVFVGTMSTIYSIGQDENITTIQDKLASVKDPEGKPFFTLARGMSLLIFYVFALQCMSTLAAVFRETKGWKWPVMQFVYMTFLAYAGAWVTYRIFL